MAHFGSTFLIFGSKKNFQENPALSCKTSYGFLAPCQNLEKANTIQRKRPDRWKDGRADRTYFTGPFQLPPGVQKTLGDIIILHICTINDNHMMYGSGDMERKREFFVILDHFLPFYPPNNPKNRNFEKLKEKTWRYHFTRVYHK